MGTRCARQGRSGNDNTRNVRRRTGRLIDQDMNQVHLRFDGAWECNWGRQGPESRYRSGKGEETCRGQPRLQSPVETQEDRDYKRSHQHQDHLKISFLRENRNEVPEDIRPGRGQGRGGRGLAQNL